jgi:iron(II)-dependent oxidoreductase
VAGAAPVAPELDAVFDSFESAKSSRGARLPARHELVDYAASTREHVLGVLERAAFDPSDPLLAGGHVFRFLANHERQHAEIVAALRLLGKLWLRGDPAPATAGSAAEQAFVSVRGGVSTMGSGDDPDGWDNERRAHSVELSEFGLQRHPVSAGEFFEFVEGGGYADDRLWSEAGARWRRHNDIRSPLHWERGSDGSWLRRTLGGLVPLDPARPVAHVSYFEAEAFARFAGARLPTELEWEHAASWDAVNQRKLRFPWGDEPTAPANVGLRHLDVSARGALPAAATGSGIHDLAGNVWEWTASIFAPYPGFSPQPYATYSAPWFDGRHRVARGGSYATQIENARCCFRNWYLPHIRALPLGIRLAR